MPKQPPPEVRVSSGYWDAAFAVTATLQAVPALSAFAVGEATGPWLYLGILLVLALLSLRARKREKKREKWEQEEAAERQLEAIHRQQKQETDRTIGFFTAQLSAFRAVAQVGPVGTPLANAVEVTGRIAGHVMIAGSATVKVTGSGSPVFKVGLSGSGRATPARSFGTLTVKQVDEATELLEGIAQDPPKTAEAVQKAADQLRAVIGIADETDQALPITPKQSAPDSEAPPSTGGGQ